MAGARVVSTGPLPRPSISTTPPTVPTGFAAEDPILNWQTHPDTRAARDHLRLIGDYLSAVEVGRTDEEESDICRSRLPENNPASRESEAAALDALADYPFPDSPTIERHHATFDLFGKYLEICASGDIVAADRVLEDLRATAATINEALAADRV